MRIGISTSVIQRGRSGVGRYVLALVRALLAEPGRDELVLFVLEEDRPLFGFAAGAAKIVPVPERFRPPLADIAWHQGALPVQARRLGLDLLHVPSYRRMIWRRPCPLVATIHDLAPFHLAAKYDPARMFYGRVVARRLARRQDEIIAVSRTTADDLLRHFQLRPGRISVVPNGIDHDRFTPGSPESARARIGRRCPARHPFFLYLARLEHPGKNHLRLIEAFSRFKSDTGSPWELVLGGSDWHGAEAIHEAAGRSPFASAIHLPGFVADEELPDWYRAAGAFVYPSLFEGFGLPPVEAMACGCPVISSPAGALGEVVGEAAALVDPTSIESIRRQLTTLALQPEERRRLRAAGLGRARAFDWKQSAAATRSIYARAASAPSPSVDPGPGAPASVRPGP